MLSNEEKVDSKMMKTIINSLFIVLFITCLSCEEDKSKEVNASKMNENIVMIKDCCPESGFDGGNFFIGNWANGIIYTTRPAYRLEVDSSLNIVQDSLITLLLRHVTATGAAPFYIHIKSNSSKMLLTYSMFSNVSIGGLYEFDMNLFQVKLVLDSNHNISSAVYLNSNNDACIYYSYGNPSINLEAGYHYYNLITHQDSLIYSYLSEEGPYETVNGFDISPDDKKLLFPLHYSQQTPKLVEYDLTTHKADTLVVTFTRQFVWVRYSHDGNQIVYSNYPAGVGGSTVYDDSEIGIIDRATLTRQILDVNTNSPYLSVNVFPDWSLDDRHIIYGSARGPSTELPGAKGFYSLFVLKNVN